MFDLLDEDFADLEALLAELDEAAARLRLALGEGSFRAAGEALSAEASAAGVRLSALAGRAAALGVETGLLGRALAEGRDHLAGRERARAEGLLSAAAQAGEAATRLGAGLGADLRRDPRPAEPAPEFPQVDLGRPGEALQAAAGQARDALAAARAGEEALAATLADDAARTLPRAVAEVRDSVGRADVDGLARRTSVRVQQATEAWRRGALERAEALGQGAQALQGRLCGVVRERLPARVEQATRERATPALREASESVAESRQATARADAVASEFEPVLPALRSLEDFAGQGVALPESLNATKTFGDRLMEAVFEQGYQDLDADYAFFRPPAGEEGLWRRYGDGRWVRTDDPAAATPVEAPAARAEDVVRMIREKGYQDLDPRYALYRASGEDSPAPEDIVKSIREKGYQDLDPGYALFRPPVGEEDRWTRSRDGRWTRS